MNIFPSICPSNYLPTQHFIHSYKKTWFSNLGVKKEMERKTESAFTLRRKMKTNHYHMLWSCARIRTCKDVKWKAEMVTALCTEEYRKPTSRGSKAPRGMERRKIVAHLFTQPALTRLSWEPDSVGHWLPSKCRRSLPSEGSLSNGTVKRYIW